MKLKVAAILLGISLGVTFAQEKPEQYPGQKDHAEPPANYFCDHVGDRAHRCDCPGMTPDPMCKTPAPMPEDDPNTEEDESQPTPQESSKCSSFCWRDHCHCHQACDT